MHIIVIERCSCTSKSNSQDLHSVDCHFSSREQLQRRVMSVAFWSCVAYWFSRNRNEPIFSLSGLTVHLKDRNWPQSEGLGLSCLKNIRMGGKCDAGCRFTSLSSTRSAICLWQLWTKKSEHEWVCTEMHHCGRVTKQSRSKLVRSRDLVRPV